MVVLESHSKLIRALYGGELVETLRLSMPLEALDTPHKHFLSS
jgi:hypothetical protein